MTTELIGRDDDLGRLAATLTQGVPTVSVVAGRAGVGKSCLVREFVRNATRRGWNAELAVATETAASIPFGALARLLPVTGTSQFEQLPYLQKALSHISDAFPEGRGVLVVDDAHLLDDASATLLHELSRAEAVSLVLTRRAGEPAPDAVREIAKDAGTRIRLLSLDRPATRRLVEAYLGGPASERLQAGAWDVGRGNPLYLRELLLDAREEARIVVTGGLWDLVDTLAPGQRLRELVAGRLRKLDDQEREACELLALGEPLDLDTLLDHVPPEVVDALVRRGFVVVTAVEHRRVASLAHPVYRETLRFEVPEPRAREFWAKLAASLTARGAHQQGDLLRVASWQLNAGRAVDAAQLTEAARWALTVFDHQLAERLARAAGDGGGFEASLVLGEALSHQLRLEEAERAFAAAGEAARDAEERSRLALAEAEHLFFRAGRPGEATALLDHALQARTLRPDGEDRLRATLAVFAAVQGDLPAASQAGERILHREEPTPEVLVATLFVSTLADAMLGRFQRAHHGVQVGLRHVDEVRQELPLAGEILEVNDIAAHAWAGEIHRAEALARSGYERAIDAGALDAVGPWSWLLLEVLLPRGRIEDARRVIAETTPILGSRDPLRLRPSLVAVSVAACAMAGEPPPRDVLEEYEGLPSHGDARVIAMRARAEAWRCSLRGDPAAAVGAALRAGATAERQTQLVWAAHGYHDAVRFGCTQGAAAPLMRLAGEMEGDLVPVLGAHAQAAADRDARALEEVSRRFETLGADLYAAEASAQAARLYVPDRPDLAHRAASRARSIARKCSGSRTPALRGLGGEDLTARELQVAQLAAQGLASQEIADRLSVSRRTVDNYLGSVYRKLGISSREDLSFTLGTASEDA